tara:strand:+ start:1315 stop:3204 length:1890 start_codon:yes stop_codon:yes gene_type:complete
MINPPSFNDLKRAKNLYNSRKRSKIIIGGPIPITITIPKLTVPNFTFNFLGINSNYVATGNEIGTSNGNQLDIFNPNKFIDYPELEFYNNYRLITTTDYLFDSLYFINDVFKQKGVIFDGFIENVGENTLRREFYNYSSEIETQSVVLTSYDFSNLQVNLSTDVSGFTGSVDTPTFTIRLSSILGNGRLLDNFLNYSLVDNFNLSATSFNNLSAFKKFPQYPTSIHPFEYIVPIDDLSANENFIITLSTNRNDGQGVYTNTKTFTFNVSAAPYEESKNNSIYTVWTTVSSLSNPLDEYPTLSGELLVDTEESRRSLDIPGQAGRLFYQQEFFRPDADQHFNDALDNATNEAIRTKYRYVNNRTSNTPTWNTAWFLYPYRDIYDLSGVSFKGESPLAGDDNSTLIAGKFGVTNSHFSSKPVGTTIKFLDRDNNLLTTTIVGRKDLGTDCRLEKYEHDLTTLSGGNIKLYKLPLFNNRIYRQKVFPVLIQAGNYSLGKLRSPEFTGSFSYSQGDEFAALGATSGMNAPLSGGAGAYVGYTSLQSVSSIFENKKLGFPQRMLASGDSSSPAFIIHNNELLLLTTFQGTGMGINFDGIGSGPGYATQGFHDRLNAGMDALGREGYQLSAVQMD